MELQENTGKNPLDSVEEVLSDHNWIYSRTTNDELIVEVAGKSCDYRLLFVWQSQMNALQLCCQYNMKIKPENMREAAVALMDVNSSLWMGHFEISKDTYTPSYRQTCLLHDYDKRKGYFHIEDLVDISLIQCERFQAVFQILSNGDTVDPEMLSLAMMETAGES